MNAVSQNISEFSKKPHKRKSIKKKKKPIFSTQISLKTNHSSFSLFEEQTCRLWQK